MLSSNFHRGLKFAIIVACSLLMAPKVFAATEVDSLDGNVTWQESGSPYSLSRDITIDEQCVSEDGSTSCTTESLDIEPGVTVDLNGHSIDVVGTASLAADGAKFINGASGNGRITARPNYDTGEGAVSITIENSELYSDVGESEGDLFVGTSSGVSEDDPNAILTLRNNSFRGTSGRIFNRAEARLVMMDNEIAWEFQLDTDDYTASGNTIEQGFVVLRRGIYKDRELRPIGGTSVYRLAGDSNITRGAHLQIGRDITVDLNGGEISVSGTASLAADGAKFINGASGNGRITARPNYDTGEGAVSITIENSELYSDVGESEGDLFVGTSSGVSEDDPDAILTLRNNRFRGTSGRIFTEPATELGMTRNLIEWPVELAGSNATVENNSFIARRSDAVTYAGDQTLTVANNSFYTNASDLFAVNNDGDGQVNAKSNYWGDENGPRHDSNAGGEGAWISDGVQYDNWLASAPSADDRVARLNVEVDGEGAVTYERGGQCEDSCTLHFASGTRVTVSAEPDGSSAFSTWGDSCSNTNMTCDVVVRDSERVAATFNSVSGIDDSQFTFIEEKDDFWVYRVEEQLPEDIEDEQAVADFESAASRTAVAILGDLASPVNLLTGSALNPINWIGTLSSLYAELGFENQWQLLLIGPDGEFVEQRSEIDPGERIYPLILLQTKRCSSDCDTSVPKMQLDAMFASAENARVTFQAGELEEGLQSEERFGAGTGLEDLRERSLYLLVPKAGRLSLDEDGTLRARLEDDSVSERSTGLSLESSMTLKITGVAGDFGVGPLTPTRPNAGPENFVGVNDYFISNEAKTVEDYIQNVTGGDPSEIDSDGDGVVDSLEYFLDEDGDGVRDIMEGSVVVPGKGSINADKQKNILATRIRQFSGAQPEIRSTFDPAPCNAVEYDEDQAGQDVWIYVNKGRISLGGFARQTSPTPNISSECVGSVGVSDSVADFKQGLADFVVEVPNEGDSVEVTIKLPGEIERPASGGALQYRKFNPEASTWYNLDEYSDTVHTSYDGMNWMDGLVPGTEYVQLNLKDSGKIEDGDIDGAKNGVITDPGGVAVVSDSADNGDGGDGSDEEESDGTEDDAGSGGDETEGDDGGSGETDDGSGSSGDESDGDGEENGDTGDGDSEDEAGSGGEETDEDDNVDEDTSNADDGSASDGGSGGSSGGGAIGWPFVLVFLAGLWANGLRGRNGASEDVSVAR